MNIQINYDVASSILPHLLPCKDAYDKYKKIILKYESCKDYFSSNTTVLIVGTIRQTKLATEIINGVA